LCLQRCQLAAENLRHRSLYDLLDLVTIFVTIWVTVCHAVRTDCRPEDATPECRSKAYLTADYMALVPALKGTSVPVRPGAELRLDCTLPQSGDDAYRKAIGQTAGYQVE
jgi:hypothetical protein